MTPILQEFPGHPGVDPHTTVYIQGCIDRLNQGDAGARGQLIQAACGRLEQLTRRMLRSFPGVRLWEQTADVFQSAVMRLYKSLNSVQPSSVREFFGLAATQIRRELIDLARFHKARPVNLPEGGGGLADEGSDLRGSPLDTADNHDDAPDRMALWTEFHRQVESLPDEEREVFGLLWYQGLSHEQAADLLGVSSKTIQRRWLSARLMLYKTLQGQMPE